MPPGLKTLIRLRAVIVALKRCATQNPVAPEDAYGTAKAVPFPVWILAFPLSKEYSRRGFLVQRYATAAGFVFL
jgi:hypothetical protein